MNRMVKVRVLVAISLAGWVASTGGQTPDRDAYAILRAVDEAAARQAWPGFRLSDWPLAIHDGTQTVLLRHPNPPPEFLPVEGRPGVLAVRGRYTSVVGNSTIELAGVRTATVVAAPGQSPSSTLLAFVEEVFHVFWLRRHTGFRPNEMARYAYPFDNERHLRLLLREDEALARSVEADSTRDAAAWAAAALDIRRSREARLAASDRDYETGLEMMEGTANYVARTVMGETPAATATRLRASRQADQIRWRFYDSGAAICFVLDRLEPGWKARIDAEPDLTTARLLSLAVARAGAAAAALPAAEASRRDSAAALSIAELSTRRQQVRDGLQGRPGHRVVIEVIDGAAPLQVSRFDPINLFVLGAGEVAHPRYLTLTGADRSVAVANPAYVRGSFEGVVALTHPAGRHPLSGGIRRVTIVGLSAMPTVARVDGRLAVEAEGLRVSLRDADSRADGHTLHISVRGTRP